MVVRAWLVVLLLSLLACSEDAGVAPLEGTSKAPVFASKVVNVDQSFSDAVAVEDDKIVVPSSMVRAVSLGTVIAGDRATRGTANPYGFLRRVAEIKPDVPKPGQTTMLTVKAELTDWLESGRIDFTSTRSLLSGKTFERPAPSTQALKLQNEEEEELDEFPAETSSTTTAKTKLDTNLENIVTVSNASFAMGAKFTGHLDIRREEGALIPTMVSTKALLALDPSVAADIRFAKSGEISLSRSWRAPAVIMPIAAPIPLTLKFAPELKCTVSGSGEGALTVSTNFNAHSLVGFDGGATFGKLDMNNLSKAPAFKASATMKNFEGTMEIAVECEIVAVTELLAFDSVGLVGRVGPYLKLAAATCVVANKEGSKTGVTVVADQGLRETFDGRAKIPILDIDERKELFSAEQALGEPVYLVGDKETCEPPLYDSCAGKVDGFYCSELVESAGYVCQDGQILRGLQCESKEGKKCTGGTAEAIQCS